MLQLVLQLTLPLALYGCSRCVALPLALLLKLRSRCAFPLELPLALLLALRYRSRCRSSCVVLLSQFDFPPKEVSDKVNCFLSFQFAKG